MSSKKAQKREQKQQFKAAKQSTAFRRVMDHLPNCQPLELGTTLSELRTSIGKSSTTIPVPTESTPEHVVLCKWNASCAPVACTVTFKDAECVLLPHCCTRGDQFWSVRQEALSSSKLMSVEDLETMINRYNRNLRDFTNLHAYLDSLSTEQRETIFKHVLPKMQELAVQLPAMFPQPIPRLTCQKNRTVTMSQAQAACLLANAFFCTYSMGGARGEAEDSADAHAEPQPSHSKHWQIKPPAAINFSGLFGGASKPKRQAAKLQKLASIFNYFERITTEMPDGTISYHRRVVESFPDWQHSRVELGRLHVRTHGLIEDEGCGMLQVDFANRRVGGGVLKDGCVQEEIRFIVCPELIIARLLADAMEDNECVVVVGSERFTNYVGYGDGYRWQSSYIDSTERDQFGRRKTEIVAIDATSFRNLFAQFTPVSLVRELNKAYCGFLCKPAMTSSEDAESGELTAVATGNWGCGAYRGDHCVKALLQMMASAVAGRDLCYFTFRDFNLCQNIANFHQFAIENSLNVGDLWQFVLSYAEKRTADRKFADNVFDYIRNQPSAKNR